MITCTEVFKIHDLKRQGRGISENVRRTRLDRKRCLRRAESGRTQLPKRLERSEARAFGTVSRAPAVGFRAEAPRLPRLRLPSEGRGPRPQERAGTRSRTAGVELSAGLHPCRDDQQMAAQQVREGKFRLRTFKEFDLLPELLEHPVCCLA